MQQRNPSSFIFYLLALQFFFCHILQRKAYSHFCLSDVTGGDLLMHKRSLGQKVIHLGM